MSDCASKSKYLIDDQGYYVLDESGNKIELNNHSCPQAPIPTHYDSHTIIRQTSKAMRDAQRIRTYSRMH